MADNIVFYYKYCDFQDKPWMEQVNVSCWKVCRESSVYRGLKGASYMELVVSVPLYRFDPGGLEIGMGFTPCIWIVRVLVEIGKDQ